VVPCAPVEAATEPEVEPVVELVLAELDDARPLASPQTQGPKVPSAWHTWAPVAPSTQAQETLSPATHTPGSPVEPPEPVAPSWTFPLAAQALRQTLTARPRLMVFEGAM
jgi:hypothetical protein